MVISSVSVLLMLSSTGTLGFGSSGSSDELILRLLLLSSFVLGSAEFSSTGNTCFCSSGLISSPIFLLLLERVAHGGKPRGCHLNLVQVLESPAQDRARPLLLLLIPSAITDSTLYHCSSP